MTQAEAKERATAVFHDWRERVLSAVGSHAYHISHIPLMEAAIADALLAVQRETAERCAEIASYKADECADYGNFVGRVVADEIMLSIRDEFGGKP